MRGRRESTFNKESDDQAAGVHANFYFVFFKPKRFFLWTLLSKLPPGVLRLEIVTIEVKSASQREFSPLQIQSGLSKT